MEKIFAVICLICGAAFFMLLAFWLVRCSSVRLGCYEKILRSRLLGAVLGAGALAWCAPQVQAVAWQAMVPWVWPMAAAGLILSVLYLDNVPARAGAGLLIMAVYTMLDFSFDRKLGMGVSGALVPWVWGCVGIVIAAKPCYLRDFLRLGAEKKIWRYSAALLAVLSVLYCLSAAVLFWKSQG